ncbi:helix-turn-helix domain-containing protein [Streptomyces jumonjinensis]|uniref:helix-turn-helix domain-containing protein n=1 Tax=Streptomyces jumonjinensis TaxID=1945 RepID=UPI0037BBD39A
MMEQPLFGRRLRELRRKRGFSQAALAGEEISTGYLSRLESGVRQPAERVVAYLAERLGVERSAFEVPSSGSSLAQALSIATSADGDGDEAIDDVISALADADHEDPLLRWQALWLVSRSRRRRGDRAEELAGLAELARTADELGLPELQCRACAAYARCLRTAGEVTRAIEIAAKAVRLAKAAELSVPDTGAALTALVSAEAEAGRLPDARAHADELVELVEDHGGTLKAEALWSAATVRFRQGDQEGAERQLERAIKGLDSLADLTLWVRLRLAAASLYLQSTPPRMDLGRLRLTEAGAALGFVGTPLLNQELRTLQAHLAFSEGEFARARAILDELHQGELWLAYRDRIRLGVLDSRLLILEGHLEKGLRQLKGLGEEARQGFNIDLSAEIWRILAEALEDAHRPGGSAGS